MAQAIPEFLDRSLGILFPHLSHNVRCNPLGVELEIETLRLNTRMLLAYLPQIKRTSVDDRADRFIEGLPEVYRLLLLDATAIFKGDPAAESMDEVIVAYPGFYAIAVYRISHLLYELKIPLIPRLLTELAHRRTGIDIHPGATVGESFFIDHGTGIVIGETTHIGNNVKVYQGVTLGALSVSRKLVKKKRHPTIGHNVVIYAGATILGGDTVVGDDTVVGGNVWLTESVSARSVVYHKSAINVRSQNDADSPIEYHI
jgi:serine O-acetyltransferase